VTAAVRTAVTAEASRIAVGTPVSPSKSVTSPWCASSPRAGLPGMMHTALSANAAAAVWSPARQPGISPRNPAAPGGTITDRSGR
jgi:hypothetical protein